MQRPTINASNWLSESAEWLYGKDENFDDSRYPTTSIRNVDAQTNSPIIRTEYFSADGLLLDSPRRGINIIRYIHKNGLIDVTKVFVRDK